VDLGEGVTIRSVTAPAFIATKLDAFADRGNGDVLASHDIEDVLNIIDGREELMAELRAAPSAVAEAVRDAIGQMLAHPDFRNAMPGLIADPDRSEIVIQRLRALAG
jgi:predicted nucleotidyltransferase